MKPLHYFSITLLLVLGMIGFSISKKSNAMDVFVEEPVGKSVLHKADTRGMSRADWLLSRHTFTFNRYYDPERMSFGLLRVLNDDWIAAGSGFPTHPHENMEIITIPLKGGLKHKDSSGGEGEIWANDVQVMTAGTGIRHSEFNASQTKDGEFLQTWVFPRQRGLKPGYDQKRFGPEGRKNQWQTIVAPNHSEALAINQDAVYTRGEFKKGKKVRYEIQFPGNGVYTFVLEGSCKVNGQQLERRDGYGVWEVKGLNIEVTEDVELLLMEVPMID
jgi:redox-sensitive bicupin YhaK (pirin superfamily)